MQTEILRYDHVEELDAIGPYEGLAEAGFEPRTVTAAHSNRVEAANGLIVRPHGHLSDRVASGMDMALWLAVRRFGPELAERTARAIEHPRAGKVWRATERAR